MAMKKMEEDNTRTDAKSKIIILISDGEDFGDDTNAAQEIEDEGISSSLHWESELKKAGQIRVRFQAYKMDRQGNVVVTKLNSTVPGGSWHQNRRQVF
jgi:Ca-activated chloride channel family protein